jgi:hypothetical protein
MPIKIEKKKQKNSKLTAAISSTFESYLNPKTKKNQAHDGRPISKK